jgi:hypothetical protein
VLAATFARNLLRKVLRNLRACAKKSDSLSSSFQHPSAIMVRSRDC